MLHIWPIAAFEDFDCAAIRMIAESFQSGGSATGSLFGAFVGDQCDGVVQADGEDIVRILEVRIGLAMLNIGAKATEIGEDRFVVFRVPANFPWQHQEFDGAVERDVLRVFLFGLGQRSTLWLLAIRHFDIGTEPTGLQIDHLAGIGMKTQLVAVWIDRCGGVAICAELAGELALRMA